MGARPTDTDLFHEPGKKEGNQTCYYNGFSRPSFGAPDLCSSCQQGGRARRDGRRATRPCVRRNGLPTARAAPGRSPGPRR
ncbi:hypothetical protein DF021_34505 [Burkholderia stagnalis]|uniref:Uncharacterized protein n=1 Tax=Burkholderia stagnalis TaxID=1503054 RepID=A0A3N7TBX7_9BURK|nr:hypothetical protein F7R25_23280 [Burkholderia stagnalis]RQP94167.1 hypothetical protein DF164_35175 [Burkholderia stagnalis]RQQ25962.1 hypothetical protein DF163_22285 [Burkholderia stagnalis]RQQ28626.1 hypothetical protein DF149_21650 [Burkholderia stagnalis]RQQ46282.1 hypothetical protein DF162_21390 [Burkholderia stagnalis]